jgi:D-alanyl-D-alanine carboxypeptidase/D-alanyl-D-alanine-endopeptidase (penicillin-binding protein 4)
LTRSRSRCWWAVAATLATAACHASLTPAPAPSPVRLKPDTADVLKRDLDRILSEPALEHSYWGVQVASLKTGETLYALNARKLMMPASNMKVVTLAAAAERLGWDFRYETRLFAAGPIDGGTLQGDLVVVGSGDPSVTALEAETLFADWAVRLQAAGVHAIAGRVIGDDDAFEDRGLGFGWSWDDVPDDYAAGVSALQFNENAVRVTIAPGPGPGDTAGISVSPSAGGLAIVNSVTTSAPGASPSIATARLPGSMRLELRGSIPAGAPPAALTVSVENPTLFFASALRDALIANGIDVRGPAVDIDDISDAAPRQPAPIVSYRSPPLSTLAVRLMKVSQNQYAETFLKTLCPDTPRTADCGRKEAANVLQSWGIGSDALIQRDGSGLSRYDYVTAAALTAILTHVDRDERLRGPFESALPIAGRDGTLANRMKGTAAEGNARAKTGSMSNVRGLSGFVTTAGGEPLVFSILANNFETPAATINDAADRIVVALASFRR